MFGKGIKMFIKIKVISFNPVLQPCCRLFSSTSCICYINSIPDQRERESLRGGGKKREQERGRRLIYFIYFPNYEIITIIRADQSHYNEWRREEAECL